MFYWKVITAFEAANWSQYLNAITVPQLPAPYCKAVPENSIGLQLLLSEKDIL